MICCFSSSFSEAQEPADQPWSTGITLTLPESMTGAKGTVIPSDDGELTLGSGIYLSELFYVPITSEAFNSMQERVLQIDPNDQEVMSSPEKRSRLPSRNICPAYWIPTRYIFSGPWMNTVIICWS